jgi:peptide deformylase
MALLPIIVAPDPRLKKVAAPVTRVDDEIRRLMDDMLETMYDAPGIGLAAPQLGALKRVIVVDVAREEEAPRPYRMANPELLWVSDEDATYEEGCLSLPEHYADVGLLATCVQHEMDHLEGILFVDHLTALKRNMILRKLLKAKKTAKPAEPRAAHAL